MAYGNEESPPEIGRANLLDEDSYEDVDEECEEWYETRNKY